MPKDQPQPVASNPERTVQITIRLEHGRRDAFQTVCAAQGLSMQHVIDNYIDATLANHADWEQRHLDGSICPISQLLAGIGQAVQRDLTARQYLQRPPAKASPPDGPRPTPADEGFTDRHNRMEREHRAAHPSQ